jgi:bacillithiol biosynthesis cysteine-adding enzyme BshC
MRCEKLNFEDIGVFSKLFLDYIRQDPFLKSFINFPPKIGSFDKFIKSKNFDPDKREILQNVLTEQYSNMKLSAPTTSNIKSLTDNTTFTLTTGHQLNIFTGPLYFIYKILSVINACEILNNKYPDFNFVPVYWMASEDHDLDEISSFSLFGKKYTWTTDQTGPVGRMDPSSIKTILDQLPEKVEIFEKAYTEHHSLVTAVRYYVNELFGKYGLVVIDGDDPKLKSQIIPIIKDDLLDHHANDLVETASSRLSEKGYKAQVYPRAINLFYIFNSFRKRIVKDGGIYKILDTELHFTEKEILKELDSNPQNFSPNVILRPLYQEIILPNIVYIGGPAEIAYWLQLKDMFDHFEVPFPILLPRNFALIINKGIYKKLQKLMIPVIDLFKPANELKQKYIKNHADYIIDLQSEEKIMHELFESILNKSKAIDQTLVGFIEAEKNKVLKGLDNIGKRLIKSEEQKQSIALNQITNIKEKLFPGEGLQERTDNFLNFTLNKGDFVDEIKPLFDPFDFRFNVIIDD